MTDDAAVRAAAARFLKAVSATAQDEIVKALRQALASGKLKGHESFTTAVSLSSDKVDLNVTIYNSIEL